MESSPLQVRLALCEPDVVIFYLRLCNIEVSMVCPRGRAANPYGPSVPLERALSSGNPADLEACSDLLVEYDRGGDAIIQCGSFSTVATTRKLVSGLKARVPLAAWRAALEDALRLLNEASARPI